MLLSNSSSINPHDSEWSNGESRTIIVIKSNSQVYQNTMYPSYNIYNEKIYKEDAPIHV